MIPLKCKNCGKTSTWYYFMEFFVCPYCCTFEYEELQAEKDITSFLPEKGSQNIGAPTSNYNDPQINSSPLKGEPSPINSSPLAGEDGGEGEE